MHVRIIWGRVKKGMWGEYKKWYMETVVPSSKGFKGLRGRQLWHSTADPDEGISFTLWDSRADMEAYERSLDREQISGQEQHLYTGDYWHKDFEAEYTSE